jgi:hypothetical protein
VVLVNSSPLACRVKIAILDSAGGELDSVDLEFKGWARKVANLSALFPAVNPGSVASLSLEGASSIRALTLFGAFYGTSHLAAECW